MRLVDADFAKERYWSGKNQLAYTMCNIFDALPTIDAVEVVRCKDCKWNNGTGACVNHKCINTFYAVVVPPNHFCSYGEKKNVNA